MFTADTCIMKLTFDVYRLAALAAVMSAWFGFALVFALRPKLPQTTEQARESKSRVGLALQGVSYALASALARPRFVSSRFGGEWLEAGLLLLTVGLAVVSVWLVAQGCARSARNGV